MTGAAEIGEEMRFKRCLVFGLFIATAALLFAACGGSNSSSSSSSTTETSTTTESPEPSGESSSTLVPAPRETEPTKIAALEPLPKAPKKGISAVFLQCDLPTCEPIAKAFKEATSVLGWKGTSIVYKTGFAQPQMTQAVNTPGVEYIAVTSTPAETIQPQIKLAKEKGIKVILMSDLSVPEPPTIPAVIDDAYGAVEQPTREITRWMINDSEGKAKIALVGLPEVPVVKAETPAAEKTIAAECPECSVEEVGITGEEIAAGTVPAKVIAFLQTHPEINYVYAAFGNLVTGIPQALKTAGLADKVKIVSENGIQTPESEMLANGEIAAYFVGGLPEWGPMAVDAMARESEGLPLPQDIYSKGDQNWLCTPKPAAKCKNWVGPATMIEQYAELWQVK